MSLFQQSASLGSVGARCIHAARLFEAAGVPAPVAAAGLAVPLGHTFPLLAVGGDGTPGVDGVLECWSNGLVDDRDNLVRAAFGADGSCFLSQRWSSGSLDAF